MCKQSNGAADARYSQMECKDGTKVDSRMTASGQRADSERAENWMTWRKRQRKKGREERLSQNPGPRPISDSKIFVYT